MSTKYVQYRTLPSLFLSTFDSADSADFFMAVPLLFLYALYPASVTFCHISQSCHFPFTIAVMIVTVLT